MLCRLRVLRTRPSVGTVFSKLGAARGLAVTTVNASVEAPSQIFTRMELQRLTEEGLASIKEKERSELERQHLKLERSMKEKLDAAVDRCGHHALAYGQHSCRFEFNVSYDAVQLEDEQLCEKMKKILKRELPLRLPEIDFKMQQGRRGGGMLANSSPRTIVVHFSWYPSGELNAEQ